jgi:selenocysteine-specific elongation factor
MSVERVIAERGWIDGDQLERLTGERRPATVDRWVMAPDALDTVRQHITDAAAAAGRSGIDVASLSEIQRAVLNAGLPAVKVTGDRAVPAGEASADLSTAAQRVLVALDAEPWSPPEIAPGDRVARRELERAGLVIQAGELWFSASAVDKAIAVLAGLLALRPEGVTVSEVREALGTSRKYTLPLLAHLDATGLTRRRGDVRIAGPRLTSRVSSQ